MLNKLILVLGAFTLLACTSDVVEPAGSGSVQGSAAMNSKQRHVFSFERGGTTVLAPGAQDSIADFEAAFVQTGDGPEPIGLCFAGFTPKMFHFVRAFGTLDSARSFFQALGTVTDTGFIWSTCTGQGFESPVGTEPNQVWTVQTRKGEFAKMLILSNRGFYPNTDSAYAEVRFDWMYRPGGSRTF